jgi:hypothetical protein
LLSRNFGQHRLEALQIKLALRAVAAPHVRLEPANSLVERGPLAGELGRGEEPALMQLAQPRARPLIDVES